ncbi:hypothetical protein IT415_02300 [bacterium]|nr:hypothetical protein [bacterium]
MNDSREPVKRDSANESEAPTEDAHAQQLREELRAIRDAQQQGEVTESEQAGDRLRVVEGTTKPEAGVLKPGEKFRFLITAAVQANPTELGTFLYNGGTEFRGSDRPVNTSLIDQDHTVTFEGRNGFILEPPEDPHDVVAAQPHDFGSNDLTRQSIEYTGDELLVATDPLAYNHINVASGKLLGVFIRQRETGEDLGRAEANSELRAFAQQYGLPVVEIRTRPEELHAGPPTVEQLPANDGNRLWKIRLPEEGVQRDIDVIQLKAGERPRGFDPNSEGFDLRVQEIDGYGESRFVMEDIPVLRAVLSQLEALSEVAADQTPAVNFARQRLAQQIASLEAQATNH